MCAKKRCNNATSIELPAAQNAELRQVSDLPYSLKILLYSNMFYNNAVFVLYFSYFHQIYSSVFFFLHSTTRGFI